jgi:hypothetical protein
VIHPTPEEIVLHHYGEATDAAAIEDHLRDCAACRAEREALREALALATDFHTPEPGADYGAAVYERLQPRLTPRTRGRATRLVTYGALAASLVAAFLLGRHYPSPGPEGSRTEVRERILLVAVGDHLERSQIVLAELVNTRPDAPADIRAEQQWAESLVPTNRLYRQAASRAGDAALADVLDDLERVLLEIANGPGELSIRQLQDIQSRIETRGILFKVRVVRGQLREKSRPSLSRGGSSS